ncbi:hypothetical protein [Synechococcus phage S-N03]|uniref:Uncharacterized protein n=1 Tax=Synechococcus phage S-N03 TaxID=2718943 RepID=A0A6G8R5Q0_9CAUD|nr:hypothetical protein PQC09_gp076 [Synechococcus phage S-N03]QIN96711.1 hypothetical protein [Synechococcus phage S-N03]
MSLRTEKRTEQLLIEASLDYIKNPTDELREEVRRYAELLLSLRNDK